MGVVGRQRRQLRREKRGKGMLVLRADPRATPILRPPAPAAWAGDGSGVGAQQCHGDFGIRDAACAGDAFRGGGIQRLSVVFADDEYLVH